MQLEESSNLVKLSSSIYFGEDEDNRLVYELT